MTVEWLDDGTRRGHRGRPLGRFPPDRSANLSAPWEGMSKRGVKAAVAPLAEHLGNTPEICRKSYVHPAAIEAFLEGDLGRITPPRMRRGPTVAPGASTEPLVMTLLARAGRRSARA